MPFSNKLIEAFLFAGTGAAIFFSTSYLLDKSEQHDDKIEELFSRLEECEKKHESSELKK